MAKKGKFAGSGLKMTGATFAQKESIVKRLNERIASIVRHAGINNEEYNRWAGKLSRSNSPYATKINTYDPSKTKLAKNKGIGRPISFLQLSRKKADIEAMSIEDLERLEGQTRGWGAVKQEAKKTMEENMRRAASDNPFEEPVIPKITESDILDYLDQKEAVRQFIEGNTDAFYALIEATGWDDIRDHTTEEIYKEVQKLDMNTYTFDNTLSEIGDAYIQRREASRERRRALGIL